MEFWLFATIEPMPYDKAFVIDGAEQLCHATGYVGTTQSNERWIEYEDSEGHLHYSR